MHISINQERERLSSYILSSPKQIHGEGGREGGIVMERFVMVDGSFKAGRWGAAAVLSDGEGHPLVRGGSLDTFFTGSPIAAEAAAEMVALFLGLRLAQEKKVCRIIVDRSSGVANLAGMGKKLSPMMQAATNLAAPELIELCAHFPVEILHKVQVHGLRSHGWPPHKVAEEARLKRNDVLPPVASSLTANWTSALTTAIHSNACGLVVRAIFSLSNQTLRVLEDFDGMEYGGNYLTLQRGETARRLTIPEGESAQGWAFGEAGVRRGWYPPSFAVAV